jgi:predicted helicase
MEDYKKEPGGKEKLKEKNSKWINDDYVKFLRYGQHFIEKNGSGVLAFINPHGFLDNPTFRGMRWNLLNTYDKIYTIDLHGNSKKKETAPDGSADVNVFDIMQGVSINVFVKTGKKKPNELGKVFHYDLFGKREMKYDFCFDSSIKSIKFKELPNIAPNYFFVQKDFKEQLGYNEGFSVDSIFKIGNSGVVSKRDKLNIHNSKKSVIQMLDDVMNLNENECRIKYNIPDDVRDWNFSLARQDIKETKQNPELIQQINYRPFDKRYFYYSGKSKGIVGWPVPVVSDHLLHKENFGLMTNKKVEVGEFRHYIIYKGIVESHAVSMKEINYVFPLYLYPDTSTNDAFQSSERRPNLNEEIVQQIAEKLGLKFTFEKETLNQVQSDGVGSFAPIDILDYIYAVLHSPNYREKYKEFLKIDFPRVPYPKDVDTFWKLVKLGGEIRQIHLLESPVVEKYITRYPIDGDNKVLKPKYDNGKVFINDTQYFDSVPEVAWNFYIGGYQPAQKWLKDRKDRTLEFDDILHYQKIIVALTETDGLMKEVDKVGVE